MLNLAEGLYKSEFFLGFLKSARLKRSPLLVPVYSNISIGLYE